MLIVLIVQIRRLHTDSRSLHDNISKNGAVDLGAAVTAQPSSPAKRKAEDISESPAETSPNKKAKEDEAESAKGQESLGFFEDTSGSPVGMVTKLVKVL